jgi:hypothetical protein
VLATDLVVHATVAKDLHIVPLIPRLDDLLSVFRVFQVGPSDAVPEDEHHQEPISLTHTRPRRSLVDVDKRPQVLVPARPCRDSFEDLDRHARREVYRC